MGILSQVVKGAVKKAAKEGAEDLAVKTAKKVVRKEVAKPAASLAVRKAPAAISARSGTPRAIAQDILHEVAQPKSKAKGRPSFAEWRAANEGSVGTMFDYGALSKVPEVAQYQLPRVNPPRGPSERIVAALANPDVERGINDTVERGMQGGGLEWYNTEPLRAYLSAGRSGIDADADYARLMDVVAATSPRSTVADNIRTASYYNYLIDQGLPIPNKPAPGYGSIAQDLHQRNVRGLADLGGWDVFKNPKPASFSQNLQGNQQVATIDTHNFRLPGILSRDPRFLETSVVHTKGEAPYRPRKWYEEGTLGLEEAVNRPAFWATKPKPNEYGYYENWQQDQARKMGISPAQYQASMWLGGGEDTGLGSTPEPFLKTLEARAKYTADRMGLDPERVLELMVRGEIPMLAKGGEVNAADLAAKYGC